jgi:hypothetical protein
MMTTAGGGAFDNATETGAKFVERWTYHAMVKVRIETVPFISSSSNFLTPL